MYDIVSYEIETYLSNLRRNTGSEVRYSVVEAMEKRAIALGLPIVGPEVGRLLFILARVSGARAVLELGSGFGYSAYWFALGLGEQGQVLCTDYSLDFKDLAYEFFRKAGLEDKLVFQVGNALDILKTLDRQFDIVFCDVNKQDYPVALDRVLPLLKNMGFSLPIMYSGRGK